MTVTVNGHDLTPGYHIDGHYGQYGIARLVEIADDLLGTEFAAEFPKDEHGALAGAYGPNGPWDIGNAHTETVVAIGDKAEAALNDATEGGRWEWVDGEFYLTESGADCPDCGSTTVIDPEDGAAYCPDEFCTIGIVQTT